MSFKIGSFGSSTLDPNPELWSNFKLLSSHNISYSRHLQCLAKSTVISSIRVVVIESVACCYDTMVSAG